jgi:transcriptional regulator with XRE-family HTH domain
MKDRTIFAERLRSARISRNLKQCELAEKADILLARTISLLEADRNNPSMDTLIKLAKALGVSTDYLLGLTDEARPSDGCAIKKINDAWLEMIQANGLALKFVPMEYRTAALCEVAVESRGVALMYVPNKLKTVALCEDAVQRNGWALEFVPDELRTTALCKAAIRRDGCTLQFIPEKRRTEALCLAAVKQNGLALQYVPDALRKQALRVLGGAA